MTRAARALGAAVLLAAAPALADPITRARVESARDAVFSQSEFTYDAEATRGTWIVDFIESLAEFQQEHPVAFWGIMAALLLALLVLLAHIVWTIRTTRRARFEGELELDGHAELERVSSRAFRERALANADAGRFEEAVRDLYLALLLELQDRGTVHFASHKALLDYRHEAAGDPAARRALAAFGRTYLPTSFGRQPLDREHFDELVEVLEGVTAAEAVP